MVRKAECMQSSINYGYGENETFVKQNTKEKKTIYLPIQ
jgi:hypothetical protein